MGAPGSTRAASRPARRRVIAAVPGLALAMLLGACAGDDSPPPLGFLYISNPESTNLLGRKVRKGSGRLANVKGQPYDSANELEGLAASPDGDMLYALSGEGDSISQYGIDTSNGELTFVDGVNVTGGSWPTEAAITPDGGYLYTADEVGGTVTGYTIGGDGRLTALGQSPQAAGTEPAGIAMHPNGDWLFVANRGSDNISVYAIAGNGSLSAAAGSPEAAGNGPAALALSADGGWLFVANRDGDSVGVFAVNPADGGLTAGTGNGTTVEDEPRGITVHPAIDVVYVVNREPAFAQGSISAFEFDPGDGSLTEVAGQPFLTGTKPRSLVFEAAEGGFAYALNRDGGDVSAYVAEGQSGVLEELNKSPFGTGQSPRAAVAVPRVK